MSKIPKQVLERQNLDKERFDKAEKISEWDEALYIDYLEHGDGEGYFENLGKLVADFLDAVNAEILETEDLPGFAWTCKKQYMDRTTAIEVLEDSIIDLDFDIDWATDEVKELVAPQSLKKLQHALDEFYEDNQHIYTWVPDFKKALLIDWNSLLKNEAIASRPPT